MTARRPKKKHVLQKEQPPSTVASASHRIVVVRRPAKWMVGIEWALFACFCLTAVYLDVAVYSHSGSFWRDETSSIQVAKAPSVVAMADRLSMDSFPVLFASVLRGWILSGAGATDAGIRLLGTLIYLGLLISLSCSCWAMCGRAPLLAFSLVAFNSTVLCFGTSIRAYGLAILLVVPCIVAFWRVARHPSRLNVACSVALALLVTHSNFQNCYLLLAIGVAGASACALSGHWRRSILILGIGAVSAVSLLVYIPTIRGYGDATTIQFVGSDFWTMLANCVKAIGCENAVLLWTWAALLLVAIVWSFRIYFQQRRSCPGEPSLHLFIALAILAAVGGGLLFFRGMNLYVNPWHVAPLIAFLAVLVECGLTQPSGTWISTCKAAIACLVTAVSLLPAWQTAQVRRTTLDLVCQALDREASPEDLVLVNPFYLSPGFNYHYHGRAPWSTLPIIPDDESVRMFPAHGIIHVMTAPHAIEPTQARIRETLSKGRRVWLVGGIQLLPANTRPPDLPPAPQSEFGWNSNPYAQVWSMQAGYFVQTHALRGRPVDLPVDGPINRLENIPLIWIEGWKD